MYWAPCHPTTQSLSVALRAAGPKPGLASRSVDSSMCPGHLPLGHLGPWSLRILFPDFWPLPLPGARISCSWCAQAHPLTRACAPRIPPPRGPLASCLPASPLFSRCPAFRWFLPPPFFLTSPGLGSSAHPPACSSQSRQVLVNLNHLP